MKAEKVIKYKFIDSEYTARELKEKAKNTIGGEVVDKLTSGEHSISRKRALKVLELLTSPEIRKTLNFWLNITIEDENGEEVNVLDI